MQEEEIRKLEDQEKMLKHQNEFREKINKHLREGLNLQKQALERQAGLKSKNAMRRQAAAVRHLLYCNIAAKLAAENPRLQKATRSLLVQAVRRELVRRGLSDVSARTIRRALNKV
jgi:hypothetical protein